MRSTCRESILNFTVVSDYAVCVSVWFDCPQRLLFLYFGRIEICQRPSQKCYTGSCMCFYTFRNASRFTWINTLSTIKEISFKKDGVPTHRVGLWLRHWYVLQQWRKRKPEAMVGLWARRLCFSGFIDFRYNVLEPVQNHLSNSFWSFQIAPKLNIWTVSRR